MLRVSLELTRFSHLVLFVPPGNLWLGREVLPEDFYGEFVKISQSHTQALRELGEDDLWQYWVRASLEVVELRMYHRDGSQLTAYDVYGFEDLHPTVTAQDFQGFMPVCVDFPELEERIVRNITQRWRWDTGVEFS